MFLNNYISARGSNSNEKLKQLADDTSYSKSEWKYYFKKYPFLKSNFRNSLNIFSWKGNGFEINILGSLGNSPLLAYHVNPYIHRIASTIKNKKRVQYLHGRFSQDLSHIRVDEKFNMFCVEDLQVESSAFKSNSHLRTVTQNYHKAYSIMHHMENYSQSVLAQIRPF